MNAMNKLATPLRAEPLPKEPEYCDLCDASGKWLGQVLTTHAALIVGIVNGQDRLQTVLIGCRHDLKEIRIMVGGLEGDAHEIRYLENLVDGRLNSIKAALATGGENGLPW